MRFFHLSDLHIGLRLLEQDLHEDQAHILHEIVRMAGERQPDAVVIAGDIYDRAVPSAEAVSLFDHFIEELLAAAPNTVMMAVSGNHDSAPRLDCYRALLARQNVYMVGQPPMTEEEHIACVTLRDEFGPVHFYLLPFVKPSMVKEVTGGGEDGAALSYAEAIGKLLGREAIDSSERNILVSHQFYLPGGAPADAVPRMSSELRAVGNIDQVPSALLAPFDYAALGHIHKPMKAGSEFYRYCGTPMQYSVDEAGQQKGILEVTLGEKTAAQSGRTAIRVETLPLVPLRQVRQLRGSLEEVLAGASGDYVSVVLTERADQADYDSREKLRLAFPRLLEVRRADPGGAEYGELCSAPAKLDPYSLALQFLGETDEKERAILKDVFETIQKVK